MPSKHKRIAPPEIAEIFQNSVKNDVFDPIDDTSAIYFSYDSIAKRVQELQDHFPEETLHAVAIKTNPLMRILHFLQELNTGMEAASFSEVELALEAKVPPDNIVFDSPAKTVKELQKALELGVHINIDNFSELNRIAELMQSVKSNSRCGLRINPQIGHGTIKSMSTAGQYSKFGIPLSANREKIAKVFAEHEWLTGLHVHSGSQGLAVDKMVSGVKAIYELAGEINHKLQAQKKSPRIDTIDIGGGFPISYQAGVPSPDISEYTSRLRSECPDLFSKYQIITEFGRFIHGHAGWVISKVEYIKHQNDVTTAIIHVGADLFLRECYNPDDWYHEVSVLDSRGRLKTGTNTSEYNIGGPLCFEGDMLIRDRSLPKIQEGDYVVIHDAGANTVNLWSRHCSRKIPKIIGVRNGSLSLVKARESLEEIREFWT